MILARKTVFDNMSQANKEAVVSASEIVLLGEPAVWLDDKNIEWYVWDDPRLGDGAPWLDKVPAASKAAVRSADGFPEDWKPKETTTT